jgi:ABC-type polysaccharide/polyol phosphate transport system ATPase subunit
VNGSSARPTGDPLVVLDGVSEAYRTRNKMGFRRRGGEHLALRDLSLTVRRSQMLGVIGGNGSGKTTLLQVVAGVIPPTRGTLAVQGRVASLVDLSAGFHRDLTGRENLLIGGVLLGLTRNEVRDRYDDIIAFSGLDAATLDWPLAAYSAGMGLRLGFSLIVHTAPDVLLVDEVLAVGDSAFQRQCVERVESLRAGGTAVMLVSHDMTLVRSRCDSVLLLDRGVPVYMGDPATAIARHLDAPLGEEESTPPAERALYETSWRVQAARRRRGVQ